LGDLVSLVGAVLGYVSCDDGESGFDFRFSGDLDDFFYFIAWIAFVSVHIFLRQDVKIGELKKRGQTGSILLELAVNKINVCFQRWALGNLNYQTSCGNAIEFPAV